jgi:hypothetical protein
MLGRQRRVARSNGRADQELIRKRRAATGGVLAKPDGKDCVAV